jgi:hypothetical protein
VLAAVEVDTAMWVASIPVFWPMLKEHWGKIFVVKEVEVTREIQHNSSDEMEMHSREGSEAGLRDIMTVDQQTWGFTKTKVKAGQSG